MAPVVATPKGATTRVEEAGRGFPHAGKNGFHFKDREQYITKCPSSAFLRCVPAEPAMAAYLAEVCVPEDAQETLVDGFLEFTRAVRGTQVHLLREEESTGEASSAPQAGCALYRLIEGGIDLRGAAAAASLGALAGKPEDSTPAGVLFGGVATRDVHEATVSTSASSSPASGLTQAVALGGEGRADEAGSPVSPVSRVEAAAAIAARVDAANAAAGGATALPGQLEALISHLGHRQTRGERREGAAASSQPAEATPAGLRGRTCVRKKGVVMAGAPLPLVLDGTAIFAQEARLAARGDKREANEHAADASCDGAEDFASPPAADSEGDSDFYGSPEVDRLLDVLLDFVYDGTFKAYTDAKDQETIEASVVVLADAPPAEPEGRAAKAPSKRHVPTVTLYFHFRNAQAMKRAFESAEWSGLQAALKPVFDWQSVSTKTFTGVVHSRREMTGLCSPTAVARDLSPPLRERPFVPAQQQVAGARRDTFDWSGQLDGSAVVQEDPRLQAFVGQLQQRFGNLRGVIEKIAEKFGSLEKFAEGYKVFGFCRVEAEHGRPAGWIYREWLPHAAEVYLFGDFNDWNRTSHRLEREPRDAAPFFFEADLGLSCVSGADKDADADAHGVGGVWAAFIPDKADGSWTLQHRSRVRVRVVTESGEEFDRVPAWATVTWKGEESNLFNAVIWQPPQEEAYVCRHPAPAPGAGFSGAPRVYEAHIGTSGSDGERLGTYTDFIEVVLPRIKRMGYNTLLLNGVIEHADYSSFGFYVSSPFAVSSRFGTPEEFRALVDAAHALGLRVLLTLFHSHASRNALEGLGNMDGCSDTYFVGGRAGENAEWREARIFDYGKTEVLRYLLSNIRFLIDAYNLDGFRFEGVTSMLYTHHGTGRRFEPFDYATFFAPGELSSPALLYLALANTLLSALVPASRRLAVANEWSGFPTLCRALEKGGLGFDYRHEAQWAQQLRAQLQQLGGYRWRLNELVWQIASKANSEKVLAAFEDADTTRVCRRPLSIALFSWESLHTHAVGGVAPHVTELAAGLARHGHEVHVFVRATGMEAVSAVHFGVTYHQCTFLLDRDFVREMGNMCESFVQRLLQVEASRGEAFDICHAHDWLAAKALVRTKQLGRTSIMTMHSTEFGRCGNNAYGGVSKSIRDIEAEACHVADRVICVSGVLKQEVLTQYGVHPEKIKVIYNGIQCEKFDGEVDAGQVKAQYGIPAMDPMFLFVGRMAVQKGPDLLMEAIPFILKFRSDAKFVFVGDGHMMSQLVQRCRQLNVTHAVRFIGQSAGAALHALFKSCDAVVVPSRNEPFGIVVLEAWSSGKPVVATNSGGPRDFVNPDNTGYLVDPEPGSIAWGCCEILKNFEHSRWMGSRGRVTAAFSFSWDSIAYQTADVYSEQLCRHDVPPNCTNARRGDKTMAFALIGPAMHAHMSVFDEDPQVANGLALWRVLRLLLFVVADGWMVFAGNEFAHPDEVDLPRPANHFSMEKNFRRWNLADDTQLKFKHCELFEAFLSHWEIFFGSQSASHLFVVSCSDEDQVVVLERGDCLIAVNLHPTQSYEGFHTGCMYSGPTMRLLFDTDEERFGGFGRLTAKSLHPILQGKDNRPHSVKLYLPSRTAAVYVSEQLFEEKYAQKWNADPIMNFTADEFVAHLETVRAGCARAISA
ncbi:glycosyltransferase [Besnoitia besnoiti]|uniref:Glycosyltransferase n=1 Tax=Besnoitia besnoiti TaxID=94643 RepID=A0A2A9M8F2_BESBE|nr:glycosyltransferase [Besnoitia besnoiti]PFH31917.1 glycosyltransferase [Besnoitia besnoiti]